MEPITAPDIENYIGSLYPQAIGVFSEMEAFAAQTNFPIVGPLVGQILLQWTFAQKPKNIFEMGSGFGYSALWFALGLTEGAKVHLTDTSSSKLDKARQFFTEAALDQRATFTTGDALSILSDDTRSFDFIFIDIEKENYPSAFTLAKKKLSAGGVLIADNLLWSGRVVKEEDSPSTSGIKKFNQLLFRDKDFVATLLPVRDGVGIGYKLR